jgi:hypothetical protein
MKIIINESQLRLIIENEGEDNLINFTPFYKGGIPPVEWDKMFLHLNKKKGGKYDGYYIDGNVNLHESDVTELKYLVKVEGSLNLNGSNIKMLPMLEYVDNYLYLTSSGIESLPMLEYVGDNLYLNDTPIESLPMLKYVGYTLILNRTPLSKKTTEEELRDKIKIKGNVYL